MAVQFMWIVLVALISRRKIGMPGFPQHSEFVLMNLHNFY